MKAILASYLFFEKRILAKGGVDFFCGAKSPLRLACYVKTILRLAMQETDLERLTRQSAWQGYEKELSNQANY